MLCVGKPLVAHKDDPNAHAIQSVLDFIGAEVGLQEHLLRVKLGGIPPHIGKKNQCETHWHQAQSKPTTGG